MDRELLVIDTSYTYDHIRERQLEDSVTCRELGGFCSSRCAKSSASRIAFAGNRGRDWLSKVIPGRRRHRDAA